MEYDSDIHEPKPKTTALEDLSWSDVLMTDASEATTQSLTSQIDHEIASYRNDIPILLNDFAKNWWRKKSSQPPLLGKLAQCYLAIPGTSVPPQRVCSTASYVVTALRLVFLSKNFEL